MEKFEFKTMEDFKKAINIIKDGVKEKWNEANFFKKIWIAIHLLIATIITLVIFSAIFIYTVVLSIFKITFFLLTNKTINKLIFSIFCIMGIIVLYKMI